MPRILHTVRQPEVAVASDGVQVLDLPVNPLSVVLVALRPLNDTGTISNFARYMAVCGALSRVSVLHRGASVFSMSGEDAVALNLWRRNVWPPVANDSDTDDERRCAVLPIFLGRSAYDPKSCFPASRRGELTLELDFDVADTGYDGMRFSVETIELVDATPKEFERSTVLAATTIVGTNDIALPLGNRVRGLLGFGTTAFTGSSPTPTLGRLSLYVDNEQHSYSATDFEVARMLYTLQGRTALMEYHSHRTLSELVGGVGATVAGPFGSMGDKLAKYCYLDLDPTGDDTYSVDASQAASFFVRVEAEAANAARFVAVEQITL